MHSSGFTRLQLLRIGSISATRLRQWQRAGLLPRRSHYTWHDVTAARALKKLADMRISLDTIQASLASVRTVWPALDDPLRQLGMEVVDGRLEMRYGGLRMDVLSGQFRLDFTPATPIELAARAVRPDDAARAREWFMSGLQLEADPERRDDAAEAYVQCLHLDPSHTSAWINLGTIRYHQKHYKEAEKCYRRAIELHPRYPLAHFNLANVLDETGHMHEAIDTYRHVIRLAPDYADAHYNLALAYQRAGRHRHAIPHWRRYLKLDQQSAWASHARAQLKRALAQDLLRVVGGA